MATAAKSSPARIAANRANAQKSTGPRTEAGKAHSRANAVKHGLTGAGVAMPDENAAAIEAEFVQAQEEFAPTTLAGMRLVRDVAMLWVRQDRARRFEAAALDARAHHAGADFDRARVERADSLIDAIEANPRAHRRALLAMPEGVDRLIAGLTMLLGELTSPAPAWSSAHHKRLDALFGYKVGDLPWNRPTRFSKAILDDYAAIGDAEVAAVPPWERQAWAITRLVAAINAEIAHLAEHRAMIDLDQLAAERAAAVTLSCLDPGKEGALAQRYLAAAGRDLSRTLRDLHHVETRYGTHPDAGLDADAAPESVPDLSTIPEPDPAPQVSPDPVVGQLVTAPVASFGGASPIASIAVPAAVPPALSYPIRPVHTAEPAVFYPPFRQ